MTALRDGQSYQLHGQRVHLRVQCPPIQSEIQRLFEPLASPSPAADRSGQLSARGSVEPYILQKLSWHLSSQAAIVRDSGAIGRGDARVELYADQQRYWLLDERWGLCQLDLLQHRFRSWVFAHPAMDAAGVVEWAVLWPTAQLLQFRGLYLLPAISIERAGWGALILCPYDIRPEILRLMQAGYRVVGQRWTLLDPREARLRLASFSQADQSWAQPISGASALGDASVSGGIIPSGGNSAPPGGEFLDPNPWSAADDADCSAVFVIEPVRRCRTRGRIVHQAAGAAAAIARAWPIRSVPAHRRRVLEICNHLSRQSLCIQAQLGEQTEDFVNLVESARRR